MGFQQLLSGRQVIENSEKEWGHLRSLMPTNDGETRLLATVKLFVDSFSLVFAVTVI